MEDPAIPHDGPANARPPASGPLPIVVLTLLSNPRLEALFVPLLRQFSAVTFHPLSLEDLLLVDLESAGLVEPSGEARPAALIVDEASVDIPGVLHLAEELPHKVVRLGEPETMKPLPVLWGEGINLRMPVSKFITEFSGWLDEVRRQLVTELQAPAEADHGVSLTERELQIMAQLSEGARYIDIARNLGLSIDTIRGHLKRVYRKFRVQSRTAAVAVYINRHTPRG